VLFGVAPVSVMSYEFIEEVKIISALEALFRVAWRAQSNVVGRAVMIRGRCFFPVLITPDDAEGFVFSTLSRVLGAVGCVTGQSIALGGHEGIDQVLQLPDAR
jgi:hypothetical protein